MNRPVSFRALLIGILLIPLNILWVVHVEYVRYSDNVSTSALFFNCIFALLVLLGLNAVVGRLWPRGRFSRGEVLTVYVMLVVSTGLCGHDQMQILFSTIHYAVQRATPDNGWVRTIIPNLPRHLVPPAGDAVRDLYQGGSTLYMPSHYLAWLRPLGWWSAFVMVVVWVMMCMSAIFRRQWDAERLSYPIAEIPLQISDPKAQILRSKLFWGAFALAASVRVMVVLHLMVPSFPALPINVQYYHISESMPWRAAGELPVSFFPFAFGLCFFLPAQLSFSVWFFYVLTRLELVGSAGLGYMDWGGFPYVSEQGVGAALGLAVAVIWYARAHLRRVWRHAWGREKMDDADEPLPYAAAFWGLVLGVAFMVGFAVHAGMRPITAMLYMSIFLVLVLVIARLRAEVGLPTIELYQVGADNMLRTVAGDNAWSRGDLTAMTLFFWMSRTHRQFPMSSQIDGLRIGDRSGVHLRSLCAAMLIASAVTIIVAFWAYLHVMYQVGYGSAKYSQMILWAFGVEPWSKLHSWFTVPRLPDASRTGGYAFGVLFTVFLSAMRVRFPWWPFHPVGYLAASSFGLSRMMVPLFFAWLIKTLLLKYGGLKAYRAAIPLFIGLIAGEFVMGMLATLLGLAGVPFPPSSGIGGL